MNEKEAKKISKFLSYVLRHHPELIGITLDNNGWTDVDLLIEKASNNGILFQRAELEFIVATNSKKRFALNERGDKIRASQGHSINIELGYTAQKPPTILYHGTGAQFVDSILATGIEKKSRQFVHLSEDIPTAKQVGQRQGKPFLFTILAEEMHKENFEFYLSDNGVWLTNHVPIKYLKTPAVE